MPSGSADALAVAVAKREVEHRLGVSSRGRPRVAPEGGRRVRVHPQLAIGVLSEQAIVREAQEEVATGRAGLGRLSEKVDCCAHAPFVHQTQRALIRLCTWLQ
eukprot:scaffold36304_cov121-Isochrysis_galbana.AAC.4